jgi:hypothetical protein
MDASVIANKRGTKTGRPDLRNLILLQDQELTRNAPGRLPSNHLHRLTAKLLFLFLWSQQW